MLILEPGAENVDLFELVQYGDAIFDQQFLRGRKKTGEMINVGFDFRIPPKAIAFSLNIFDGFFQERLLVRDVDIGNQNGDFGAAQAADHAGLILKQQFPNLLMGFLPFEIDFGEGNRVAFGMPFAMNFSQLPEYFLSDPVHERRCCENSEPNVNRPFR